MPSDLDLDPPVSHAIANGWADFAETSPRSVAVPTPRRMSPFTLAHRAC
jgi:hypothetical protein